MQEGRVEEIERVNSVGIDRAKSRIKDAIAFLNKLSDHKDKELLEEIERKLEENKFNLVVLGQFKRGKTTFVNALLGERVLPSAVLPLTSIVTLVEWGNEKKAEVVFMDGSSKEVPVEEIELYVTEKENPENRKGVKFVRVFYPSGLLKKGLILVDTPGVGSLYDSNTDVTYGFLPRVDAAIFLLTVDPPLSREEVSFLKDVCPHVERMLFVLNKIDYIDPKDLKDVLQFVSENISSTLSIKSPRVFPVSAKMALKGEMEKNRKLLEESGILPLKEEIEGAFLEQKAHVVINSSANKVLSLLSDQLFRVELELKSARTPLEELERKIKEFQKIKGEIHQEERDTEFLFKGEVDSLIKLINMDVEKFQRNEASRILEKLFEILEKSEGKKGIELSRAIDEAIKKLLVERLDSFVGEENKKINDEYERIARRFSERINSIIERLMKLSADLFEVPLELFKTEEELTKESSLWYKLDDPPRLLDIAEGMARAVSYTLLPSSVVKKKIKNELKKKLPEKLDMNCGRIRSDFEERVKKSSMELRWEMKKKMEQTIRFVEEAIEKAKSARKKSQKDLDLFTEKLEKEREELRKLMEDLKALSGAREKNETSSGITLECISP